MDHLKSVYTLTDWCCVTLTDWCCVTLTGRCVFQITPRAISAHAYVNAAFVLPFDPATARLTERPTLLFGGINGQFVSDRSRIV